MFDLFWRGYIDGDSTSSLGNIFQLLTSIYITLLGKFKPIVSGLKIEAKTEAVSLSCGFSIHLVVGDVMQNTVCWQPAGTWVLDTIRVPSHEDVENLPACQEDVCSKSLFLGVTGEDDNL